MKEFGYTHEQVAEGCRLHEVIESVPLDKRPIVKLMVESFISGMMAAQEHLPVRATA